MNKDRQQFFKDASEKLRHSINKLILYLVLSENLRNFLTIKTVLEELLGYLRLNTPKAPKKQKNKCGKISNI